MVKRSSSKIKNRPFEAVFNFPVFFSITVRRKELTVIQNSFVKCPFVIKLLLLGGN